MRSLSRLPLCAVVVVFVSSACLFARQVTPAVRITSPIDENQLVTLKGNTSPLAVAQNDRGPVSTGLPMPDLTLVLSRSPEEQTAFDQYIASEYDPSSPDYHQWLTPTEIGERFGPTQADITTLSTWLNSQGFQVSSVAPDRMTIRFSGTAALVETAFHIQIHNLFVNGRMHFANMTNPQIPAAIAPVVVGIKGLHNFFPHPLHRMGSGVKLNPDAQGWTKLQSSPGATPSVGALSALASANLAKTTSSPRPNYYYPIPNSGGSIEEDVAPYDFAKIYNLPSTWPSSTNGSGQTITIIGTSDIDLSDVSQFKTTFGLPAGLKPVIANGPDGDPGICSGFTNVCNDGDLDENSLDVEWSGAVAPGAQIVLVTDAYNSQTQPTNDPIFDGAQWAIDNASVSGTAVYGSRILSVSYGTCELMNGTASNVAYNDLWETAAGAGIAVFVATGDSGSPSCDDGGDSFGNPYEAQYGLSVNALASTPYNTAVGGTDLNWCDITQSDGNISACTSSDASKYWNTSNSSQQASAKGYVPEIPWNNTCQNPALLPFFQGLAYGYFTEPANTEAACNFVYQDWLQINELSEESGGGQYVIAGFVDTIGGSGGASNCVVNTSTSTTTGSCDTGDDSTGSSYGNLTLVNDGWPKPSWQTGTGVPSDGVRDLPDVSFFAGNGMFDSATLICVSNDDASCSDIGNTETGGNGEAEEIGGTSVATPEMAGVMALINQKVGAAQGNPDAELYKLAGMQTYSSCSSENGSTSNGCYFNDIDQGTNAMPCNYEGEALEGGAIYDPSSGEWDAGTAYLGLASPNCSIENSGDAVGTLSGYGAVTGYDQATGLGSLNIANVIASWPAATVGANPASVSIGLSATSIQTSQSLTVNVTVSGPDGTPTGDVTLSASANGYSSAQTLSTGNASFTIPSNTFTSAGTVTLTASYSGDSTYAANSASTTVAITSSSTPTATFTLGSITSPAAISPGSSATATATASSSNGYAGMVTLNCSLTSSPSGAVNLPTCSPSGTITLSASTTSGNATLSVTTTPAITESSSLNPANGKGLFGAGGGAVLALLFFFGVPARRKAWRAMLGMVVLLVTLGSLAACGGGSSGGTTTIPGTTAGTYTFTVTAVGSPTISSTQTQTFNVTVN